MPLQPVTRQNTPNIAAVTQSIRSDLLAPPMGGLNLRDSYLTMPQTDAVVASNVIFGAGGPKLRGGWREHVTNLGGTVETLMAFTGAASIDQKLFAAVGQDIFDVTTSTDTPVPLVNVAAAANGVWSWRMFSNSGNQWLVAVNNGGGYWTYDAVGGWVDRTASLTGGPSNLYNITSIWAWANRLWFTFEGDPQVWYLPIENITGALSAFDMGSNLSHGGVCIGGTNWTRDGALNLNDFLVVFGSEGDVIVYQGSDPDVAANFEKVGVWYVGRVPIGSRFFNQIGTDVYIVCELGVVPLSILVTGKFAEQSFVNPISTKIQSVLSPTLVQYQDFPYWEIQTAPELEGLIIKQPPDAFGRYRQWVLNTTIGAWSTFDNVPAYTMTRFQSVSYFGTVDGRVCMAFADSLETDGQLYDGSPGAIIVADVQTAFYPFNTPQQLKQAQFARPMFIAKQAPAVRVAAMAQFKTTDNGSPVGLVGEGAAVWDASFWDQAYWTGSANMYESYTGLYGLAYLFALRVQYSGKPGTTFAGSHFLYTVGGMI